MRQERRAVSKLRSAIGLSVAAGGTMAAYMAVEAQWTRLVRADLKVPGLPNAWSGVTVLHLSDIHAGLFPTNERSLRKAVEWARPLQPDLVFLTGDVLGDPARSERALHLLSRLQPPLGQFAVTGNHEFGIGKSPFAHTRDTEHLWPRAGVTLLRDRCVALPERGGTTLTICGADYLTGGFGLDGPAGPGRGHSFPILLAHEPPPPESALADCFPLVFAGHTHGGQIRVPTARGLVPLNGEEGTHLGGVYRWGQGHLVVSTGIGTSFVPLRLFTRPEAVLWRLV